MPSFTIEGNPGSVRSKASKMRTHAETFTQTGDALATITTDGWRSRAGDRFREKFDTEPDRWRDAGAGWERAAAALETFAGALQDAKDRADWAKEEYARGEQVTRDARAAYDADVDRAQGEAARDRAAGMTVNLTIHPFSDPGEEIRQGAISEYDAAKADLDTAAHECASGVKAGCADAPEKRKWYEKVGGAVGGFFAGAGEALMDLGKLAYFLTMPHVAIPMMLMEDLNSGLTPEEVAAKYKLKLEDAKAIGEYALDDPVGFGKTLGKSILDWDTWADDPARAAGRLLPDAVIAVLTAGTGTAATRGAAATKNAIKGLDDLADLRHLDGLGNLSRSSLPDPVDLGPALSRNGWSRDDLIDIINERTGGLSPTEVADLNRVRDSVPVPDGGTPMQKVITPAQFDNYWGRGEVPETFSPDGVGGSLTRAGDTAHLDTPDALRDSLRLDYPGSPFEAGDDVSRVVRFTSDDAVEVPRTSDMGGSGRFDGWDDPFTGNGFTKAHDDVVPEWQPAPNPDLDGAPVMRMREGAEMWEVRSDGREVQVGVLRGGEWVEVP